jgi:maltose O-acetyltransferase
MNVHMTRFILSLLTKLVRAIRRIYSRILRKEALLQLGRVGSAFTFDPLTSLFYTPKTIRVGSNVFFNQYAYVSGDITIGNNVMFGPSVKLMSGNHLFAIKGKSTRWLAFQLDNPENVATLVVEDEVWVGAGVTVLGKVTVGIGAVVGAGSVVVADVVPFTISVGNPCRPVRLIFSDEDLKEHLQLLGYSSNFADQVISRRRASVEHLGLRIVDQTSSFDRYYYKGKYCAPLLEDFSEVRNGRELLRAAELEDQ